MLINRISIAQGDNTPQNPCMHPAKQRLLVDDPVHSLTYCYAVVVVPLAINAGKHGELLLLLGKGSNFVPHYG